METTLNRQQRRVVKRKLKKSGDMVKPSYFDGKYLKQTGKLQPFSDTDKLTMNSLVSEMWSILMKQFENNPYNIKVLDPSCGRGPFLVKAYEILFNDIYLDIEDIDFRNKLCIDSLYGFDIDKRYVNVTILQLEEIQRYYGATVILKPNVKQADFLNIHIDMKFDVIIGNPPYQETNDNGKSNKSSVRLWAKFINKSLDSKILKDGGYLSYVIPSNWAGTSSATFHQLSNYDLLQADFSSFVSDSFKEGGSMVFTTILLRNSNTGVKPNIKFNQGSKVIDLFSMGITPAKSNNLYDFTILEKMIKSNQPTHRWMRNDNPNNDISGNAIVMAAAKGTQHNVEWIDLLDDKSGRILKSDSREDLEGIMHNLNMLKMYKRLRWVVRSGMAITMNIRYLPIPVIPLTEEMFAEIFNLNEDEKEYVQSL